jgi:hypothetical protein
MTDQSTPAAPLTVPEAETLSFDTQMDAWLNHDFGVADEAAAEEAAAGGDGPAAVEGAVVEPKAPAAPEPKEPAATPEPKAAPTAGNEPAPAATPEAVDPALMAAMVGLTEPTKPAAAPTVPAPAAVDDNADYTPLPPVLKLDDNLINTIFQSEDPNQQKAALGTLLSNYGNALMALADRRMRDHYAPKVVEQVQSAQTQRAAVDAMNADFYGTFPDLNNQRAVVAKAFNVVAQQHPELKYGPEARDKVGNLARAALRQMGVVAPAAAAAATPPVKAKPKASVGYVAGGARPAGAGEVDHNSASAVFDQITATNF